jgi:plastocyanin
VRRGAAALALGALLVAITVTLPPAPSAPGAATAKAKKKRCHVRKRGHRRVRVCRPVKHKPKAPSSGTTSTAPTTTAPGGGGVYGSSGGGGTTPPSSGGGSSGGESAGGGSTGDGGGSDGSSGGDPPLLPHRLGVDEREYSVVPTYHTVAAGDLEFDPVNHGEDAHDFSIRNAGGQIASVALDSGETKVVNVNLPAGTYTLYCSLADHEALGMKATLTVQ